MGITVGAALKKAAIVILGNPKTLKKLLFAVLVVFVALLLPMVMVVCLFSGSFQVDSGELLRYVEANLTASDVELLQNVETTMMEIENAMIEAELSADVGAAQALYIMALEQTAQRCGRDALAQTGNDTAGDKDEFGLFLCHRISSSIFAFLNSFPCKPL